MKFVLIVLLAAKGGSGMSLWGQPALTSAVFADRNACEAAASIIKREVSTLERETRLDFVRVAVLCLPDGA